MILKVDMGNSVARLIERERVGENVPALDI